MNEIVFSKDKYHNNKDKMFEAIVKQLELLMENDYICKVYDDDVDIIVIQYEHNNNKDYWGTPDLCWLTEDEVEAVENYRTIKEEEDSTK